jgi:uncharacterized protein (DUF2141 family)
MVGAKREILENIMRLKLIAGGIVLLLSAAVMAADLSVEVTNIEHDKGKVRVVLYDNPDSFLNEKKAWPSGRALRLSVHLPSTSTLYSPATMPWLHITMRMVTENWTVFSA